MTKNKIGFITLLFSAVCMYWGSHKLLKVTRETIEIEGLNKNLDGLKILHITDLHSNSPEKMNVDIWKKANTLDFDIVCITGDIVDRNAYQIEPHLEGIESIRRRAPVFFAEGNHDHYSMKKLKPYFDDLQVTLLIDERTVYEYNGEVIDIIGLSDFYTANLNVSSELLKERQEVSSAYTTITETSTAPALSPGVKTTHPTEPAANTVQAERKFSSASNMSKEVFRIVLAHQPQHIDYVDLGETPTLVLSGHTHGGQIRLPFLPTLYAPAQGILPKYGYGTYDAKGAKLFVSKGIGYTGKAPLRFFNRPEICVITLKAV